MRLLCSSPLPKPRLPDRLVLSLRGTYAVLDQLAQREEMPTVDVEALVSQLIDLLGRYGGRRLGRVAPAPSLLYYLFRDLDEIAEDLFGLDSVYEDFERFDMMRRIIFNAFKHADAQLERRGVYLGGKLPYTYVQRVHRQYALLRLKANESN